MSKNKKPTKVGINTRIPKQLHRQLKYMSFKIDEPMSSIIAEAITNHLNDYKSPTPLHQTE